MSDNRRQYNKKYRDANPEKIKGWKLKRNFGITLEQYNEMFVQQGGCCAICKRHQSEFKRALAVDHCHQNGMIRGLLCLNCNQGIGKFKDDVELLKTAIEYVQKERIDGIILPFKKRRV